jgi:GTP pyrophosphokinase
MLLAMARDVRVMLIKLADRLHNMRTLEAVDIRAPPPNRAETLEIYAPIAHRLGLNTLFRELEELSFEHLYPLRYKCSTKRFLRRVATDAKCLAR